MKIWILCLACICIATQLTAVAIEYKFEVIDCDASVGGKVRINLSMRQVDPGPYQTLASVTLHASVDSYLSNIALNTHCSYAGYQTLITHPTSASVAFWLDGSGVNASGAGDPTMHQGWDDDCPGITPGVFLTNSWMSIATLVCDIADIGTTNITWNVSATHFSMPYNCPQMGQMSYSPSGQIMHLYYDLSQLVEESLSVQMSEMTAIMNSDHSILIRWLTQSEVDCLGFHILRSSEPDGEYIRITNALISGHGNSSANHTYNFKDYSADPDDVYWYKIEEIESNGTINIYGPFRSMTRSEHSRPQYFTLAHNYPNPFNPVTQISFTLPEATQIELSVFNLKGQLITSLADGFYNSGYYQVQWDGRDQNGSLCATGTYTYMLVTDNFIDSKTMTFIK